jgi:hypothetical protein
MEKTMKSLYALSLSLALGVTSSFFCARDAFAFTLTDTVSGTQNLYHDNWGHPYNIPGSGESDALGAGTAPVAFGNGFAFTPNQDITITATGCVVDAGTLCTGAEGLGGLFRGLTVYSLIGIWSSDVSTIKPITLGTNSAFFIGSSLSLITPDYGSSLYLFLGENDGNFADNSSFYAVNISGKDTTPIEDIPSVPEPQSIFGLLSMLSLGFFIKERKIVALRK